MSFQRSKMYVRFNNTGVQEILSFRGGEYKLLSQIT